VTEDLLHVDFMRVDITQTISVEVPVEIVGESPAVELRGGTLLQFLQSILVEGRPMDIPASIKVDISALDDFDKAIFVRDVSVGRGLAILTDADEPIARVNPLVTEAAPERVEEAAAPAAAEGEAEEQKEGA
jgi:large subunit ribosomal protein L25